MNIVLIVPTSLVDKANALGAAMGWGPESYSVPLSADGSEPATHWGLNLANPGDSFLAMLAGAGQGQMPEVLLGAGYPPEDFAAVVGSLVVDMAAPFADAIAANGLSVVVPE